MDLHLFIGINEANPSFCLCYEIFLGGVEVYGLVVFVSIVVIKVLFGCTGEGVFSVFLL